MWLRVAAVCVAAGVCSAALEAAHAHLDLVVQLNGYSSPADAAALSSWLVAMAPPSGVVLRASKRGHAARGSATDIARVAASCATSPSEAACLREARLAVQGAADAACQLVQAGLASAAGSARAFPWRLADPMPPALAATGHLWPAGHSRRPDSPPGACSCWCVDPQAVQLDAAVALRPLQLRQPDARRGHSPAGRVALDGCSEWSVGASTGAAFAWERGLAGQGTVVAVLDTGVGDSPASTADPDETEGGADSGGAADAGKGRATCDGGGSVGAPAGGIGGSWGNAWGGRSQSWLSLAERSSWTNEGETADWAGHGSVVAGIIAGRGAGLARRRAHGQRLGAGGAAAAGGFWQGWGAASSSDSGPAPSLGCPGVAPAASVLSLRVFARGQISFTSWIVDALNHALASGADVVNLSVGGPDSSDVMLARKVSELASLGVLVVSAIGNDGPQWGTLSSPADMEGVAGVGGAEWPPPRQTLSRAGGGASPGSRAEAAPGPCPDLAPDPRRDDGAWAAVGARVAPFSSRGMVTWAVGGAGALYGRAKPDLLAPARAIASAGAGRGGPGSSGGTADAGRTSPGGGSLHRAPLAASRAGGRAAMARSAPAEPAEEQGRSACGSLSGTSVAAPIVSGAALLATQALRRREAELAARAAARALGPGGLDGSDSEGASSEAEGVWDTPVAGWALAPDGAPGAGGNASGSPSAGSGFGAAVASRVLRAAMAAESRPGLLPAARPGTTAAPFGRRLGSLANPGSVMQCLRDAAVPLAPPMPVAAPGRADGALPEGQPSCQAGFVAAGQANAAASARGPLWAPLVDRTAECEGPRAHPRCSSPGRAVQPPAPSADEVEWHRAFAGGWFSAGAGLTSPAATAAWARAYRPRASAHPPAVLLGTDCERWMPLCASPLDPHPSAPPLSVNLTLSNGVGARARIAPRARLRFHGRGSEELAAACNLTVALSAPAELVAWGGWLGVSFKPAPADAAACRAAAARSSSAMPSGRRLTPDGRPVGLLRGAIRVLVATERPVVPPETVAPSAWAARRRQARDAAVLMGAGGGDFRDGHASLDAEEEAAWSGSAARWIRVAGPAASAFLQGDDAFWSAGSPSSAGDRQGASSARQWLTVPFDVALAGGPAPRSSVVLVDTRHSLAYPPALSLRDDLSQPSDTLDWRGDHPHTNLRPLASALGRDGWQVEEAAGPWTGVDASRAGLLVVVDPEDEWTPAERRKLVDDVAVRGMGLLVLADWFDERVVSSAAFVDGATRSTWRPLPGASNVPALNWLLAPFGAQFGGRAMDGDVLFAERADESLGPAPRLQGGQPPAEAPAASGTESGQRDTGPTAPWGGDTDLSSLLRDAAAPAAGRHGKRTDAQAPAPSAAEGPAGGDDAAPRRALLQSPPVAAHSSWDTAGSGQGTSHGDAAPGAAMLWRWARFASGVSVSAAPPGARVWVSRLRDQGGTAAGRPSQGAHSELAAVMAAFEATNTFGELLGPASDSESAASEQAGPATHGTAPRPGPSAASSGGGRAAGRVVLLGDSSCADDAIPRRGPPATAPPLDGGARWRGLCSSLLRRLAGWAARREGAALPLAPGLASLEAAATAPDSRGTAASRGGAGIGGQAAPQAGGLREPAPPAGGEDIVLDRLPVLPSSALPSALEDATAGSSLGFGRPLAGGFLSADLLRRLASARPDGAEPADRLPGAADGGHGDERHAPAGPARLRQAGASLHPGASPAAAGALLEGVGWAPSVFAADGARIGAAGKEGNSTRGSCWRAVLGAGPRRPPAAAEALVRASRWLRSAWRDAEEPFSGDWRGPSAGDRRPGAVPVVAASLREAYEAFADAAGAGFAGSRGAEPPPGGRC